MGENQTVSVSKVSNSIITLKINETTYNKAYLNLTFRQFFVNIFFICHFQGVFVFKNNFKPPHRNSKRKKKRYESKNFENIFSKNLWYQSYKSLWNMLEEQIEVCTHLYVNLLLNNMIEKIAYFRF